MNKKNDKKKDGKITGVKSNWNQNKKNFRELFDLTYLSNKKNSPKAQTRTKKFRIDAVLL